MQKSLVLVTVDCLRADHVGFMGYERPTTPFLDSLAAEGFVFPAAIVAGAPTYYSFPAILASRYPLALGRDVLGLAPQEATLASELKQAGYATAAFVAANPYISSRFGYDKGFDTFRDFLGQELDHDTDAMPENTLALAANGWASRLNRELQKLRPRRGPLSAVYDELYFQYCQRWATSKVGSLDTLRRFPAADVIVDQARAWLESVRGGRFFLWLHLMDPHSPYCPTQDALDLMAGEPVTPFRARYLNCFWNRSDLGPKRLTRHREEIISWYDAGIRWVDAQMARLVEALRRRDLWENCIFAFTADHGEEFLDHGGRYHPPSRLMEELIRVPLLLRVPGAAGRELSKSPFSMLHLAPTLLDAADLPIPAAFCGRSYWPQVQQGASYNAIAISECVAGCTNPFRPEKRLGPRVLAVREGRFKLILHFDPPADDLYDLEADPQERSALRAPEQQAIRRRLLERAREHLRRSLAERDPTERIEARLAAFRLEWAKPANRASPVAS
jgi:arylsulfatase A-like enzyme